MGLVSSFTLTFLSILFAMTFLGSCSTSDEVDPLVNSKKLIKEGHRSLYKNGALQVPYTQVKLIAPGPDTLDLAQNLVGIKARESLLMAVTNISKTYGLAKKGTLKSFELSEKVYVTGRDLSGKIHKGTLENSTYLVKKSAALPYGLTLEGIAFSQELTQEMEVFARKLSHGLDTFGDEAKREFLYSVNSLSSSLDSSAQEYADQLRRSSLKSNKENKKESTVDFYRDFSHSGEQADKSAQKLSHTISTLSKDAASKNWGSAKDTFILGYLAFPSKVKSRFEGYGADTWDKLSHQFNLSNDIRKEYTDKFSYIINDSIVSYSDDVLESLEESGDALTEGVSSLGITLGAFKSLVLFTKSLLWNATLKPFGQMTGGALGYTLVNTVVFPTMVLSTTGYSLTEVAVEVTWDSSKSVYDFVAPTMGAALSSSLALIQRSGGSLASGIMQGAGKGFKYSLKGVGALTQGVSYSGEKVAEGTSELYHQGKKVLQKGAAPIIEVGGKSVALALDSGAYALGSMIEVSSEALGKGGEYAIRYIGIPAATAGVPLAAGGVGVVVGTAGVGTGATGLVVGESTSAGAFVLGTTLAGTTVVAGTTASVSAAGGLAVYETLKGVTIPAGYVMGSGVVLTYGNISQLGAQAILAASDASYLVLSLEGPRWVLYAVKGKLFSGSSLSGGTVLDLQRMKEEGEEFEYIPITKDELQGVMSSFE